MGCGWWLRWRNKMAKLPVSYVSDIKKGRSCQTFRALVRAGVMTSSRVPSRPCLEPPIVRSCVLASIKAARSERLSRHGGKWNNILERIALCARTALCSVYNMYRTCGAHRTVFTVGTVFTEACAVDGSSGSGVYGTHHIVQSTVCHHPPLFGIGICVRWCFIVHIRSSKSVRFHTIHPEFAVLPEAAQVFLCACLCECGVCHTFSHNSCALWRKDWLISLRASWSRFSFARV